MRVGLLCGSLLCSVSALPLTRPTALLSRMSVASVASSPTGPSEAEAIALQKREMRAEVEARLQAMHDDDILAKSTALCTRAHGLAAQRRFDGACIYLSMGKEVQTGVLAESLFRNSKRVFVPKIMGRDHNDLRMFEAQSLEQIAAFPKNKWNIPEPPKAEVLASADPIDAGGIDVVFMPGVAFDTRRARLGHGKAYYGECCLRSCVCDLACKTCFGRCASCVRRRLLPATALRGVRVIWPTKTRHDCTCTLP